jgi:hypothetical protein
MSAFTVVTDDKTVAITVALDHAFNFVQQGAGWA